MAKNQGSRRTDYQWEGIAAGAAIMASITTSRAIQEVVAFANAGTLYRCRGEVKAFLTTSGAANAAKSLSTPERSAGYLPTELSVPSTEVLARFVTGSLE